MSQRTAAGSNPRESHPCIPHAALLIACDALNARTLTVREYQPVGMSWPASSALALRRGDDRSTFQRKASWRTRRPARYRQQRIRLPYDAPPLSCGHIFQGAVPKRGKGQTVSALVTIEEISLISRWRFMYSSMHTWGWPCLS